METFTDLQNETFNLTSDVLFREEDELSSWIKAIRLMRNICIPLIAAIGMTGSTLSFLVFCSKSMKKSTCSVFLASLAVVDCLFLLSIVVNWLDGEIKGLITTDTTCQLLIFITNVTDFLSVGFIVDFTFERFVAICFPLKRHVICSGFREKVLVALMTLFSCVWYNYSFWASSMQQWGPEMKCSHKTTYFKFLFIITWVDTVMTIVIPFVLISTLNCLVLRAVLLSQRTRNSKVPQYVRARTPLINTNIPKTAKSARGLRRSNHKVRVTKTLVIVSMTFLGLNLPSHVVRLYNLISSVASDNAFISEEYYFLQEVTLMFHYLSFSCNFFLYTLFGSNFKKSLIIILQCKSSAAAPRAKIRSSTQTTTCVTPV